MHPKEVDLVIYHSPCVDGTAGAWPFWRENRLRFKTKQIEFFGYRNDNSLPPNVKGKNVVMVDCCYSRENILKMKEECKELLILDHHITNKNSLEGIDNCVFDMNRSGAQIAWDYVYGEESNRPWFIEIIADRDLWKWEIQDSKDIGRGMYVLEYCTWSRLEDLYQNILKNKQNKDISYFKELGYILNKHDLKKIKQFAKKAKRCIISVQDKQYNVMVGTCDLDLRSDVGNYLVENNDCDFAAIYTYDLLSNEWWISLRTNENKNIDLGKISKHFGGGGHKCSAGFILKDGQHILDVFK